MASKCPICRATVKRDHATHPFCSSRCRAVDLGAWLGGQYAIADASPDYFGQSDEHSKEQEKLA